MTKAMRLFGILAVAALVVAAASPARAACIPNKTAGQLSDVYELQTTLWPDAVGDAAGMAMVGRMWQGGLSRATMNEGAYSIDRWLPSADVLGLPGTIMYAFLGEGDVTGCPAGNLITVMQSPRLDQDGGSFVVAKVLELSGPALDFDYCKTSSTAAGWVGKPIAKPAVTSVKVPGTRQFNLTVAGPNVSDLFYGEPGMLPTEAIKARRLYQFIGPGAPGTQRNPATTAWTYTGQQLPGVDGGTITLPTLNCDTLGAGNDLFLAWALEFEGSVVLVSDFVGKNAQVVCNSGLAAPGKFKNIDKRQGPKNK